MLVESGREILEITQKRGLAPKHLLHRDRPFWVWYSFLNGRELLISIEQGEADRFIDDLYAKSGVPFGQVSLHYFFTVWFVCVCTWMRTAAAATVTIAKAFKYLLTTRLLAFDFGRCRNIRSGSWEHGRFTRYSIISLATIIIKHLLLAFPHILWFCLILNINV